jgi:hypothetical protein
MRRFLNYFCLVGLSIPLITFAGADLQTALSSPEAVKEIDQKSFLSQYGLDNFPVYYDNMTPEAMLYQQYKEEGKAAPAWLRDTIFPHANSGLRDVGRDGGDDQGTATVIDDTSVGSCFNDTGATDTKTDVLLNPQELPTNCNSSQYGGSFAAPDAWYSFTLEVGTYVNATTVLDGTLYDTAMALLDADLIPYAINDDQIGDALYRSTISCIIPAGSYYLVIDGYNDAEMGEYELEVCFEESPCDTYTAEITNINAPLTITGSTVGAPNVYSGPGGNVGYELTIPQTGIWDISACNAGTDYSADFWLFDTDPCIDGQLLFAIETSNCPDPFPAKINGLQLDAGIYHLMVGNTAAAEGNFEILIEETPDAPTSGGPDEMGYAWVSSLDDEGTPIDWMDISTLGVDTGVHGDDVGANVELPFTFPFYENVYTSVNASSNGYLTFGTDMTDYSNTTLPDPGDFDPNDGIYPYWDDFTLGTSGTIFYYYDADNDRAIFQWHEVPQLSGGTAPNTFQALLYANGAILFQYLDMDETDLTDGTIGIENSTGTIGLQINFEGEGAFIGDNITFLIEAGAGDFVAPIIEHDPIQSVETELAGGYQVEATITDDTTPIDATLTYIIDATETSITMQNDGDTFTADIPHQEAGTSVSYYITAVDSSPDVNTRITQTWSFELVSSDWPPVNFAASDGLADMIMLGWDAPVNPALVNLADYPLNPEELSSRYLLSKEEALEYWNEMHSNPVERNFIEYNVYRDGDLIASTTDNSYLENMNSGIMESQIYTYAVTANYDSGESAFSLEDEGHFISLAGGYIWISSEDEGGPEFDWMDIAGIGTDTGVHGDDAQAAVDLPFAFDFFGNEYSSVLVSSNGYLSFGESATPYWNVPIPDIGNPNDCVFTFWDDLSSSTQGTIYFYYDADNARMIFQWNDVPQLGSTTGNFFQAILYASGQIDYQYLDMDEADLVGASVGIENSEGTLGVQVTNDLNGLPIADELAIKFLPALVHSPLPDVDTETAGNYLVEVIINGLTPPYTTTLTWTIDGNDTDVVMDNVEGNLFTAEIPHQEAGITVSYHIVAISDVNGHQIASPMYEFSITSSTWPPLNMQATTGLVDQILLTWDAPGDPALFNLGDMTLNPDELMTVYQMTKVQALAYFAEMHERETREFIEYIVYRDEIELARTANLNYLDGIESGLVEGQDYDYTVTALYDAGESDPSNIAVGRMISIAGGYTWMSSNDPGGPEFNWVDISGTGSALAMGDDAFDGPIDLGIDFPFFDEVETEVFVCSNGFLSFGAGYTSLGGTTLPNEAVPNNLIALFWDDLDPVEGAGQVLSLVDAENNRFIIQYNLVEAYPGGGPAMSFQVILYESGQITLQYLDIDEADNITATVGIENSTGMLGIQITDNDIGLTIEDELTVMILPAAQCEAVDCDGIAEVEPNEGWNDDNASYGSISCDETICGDIMDAGAPTGTDWFQYNHFGGDVTFNLEVSTFDAVLSLHEFDVEGDIIAEIDVMPACAGEILSITALESGSYLLQVRHEGDAEIEEPGNYALSLLCSGDPCSGHIPIECDGTPEVEPNEGWNDGNESYGEIAFGEMICGTVTANDGVRDMDWFHFNNPGYINLDVTSEIDAFDGTLFLTDFSTDGETLIAIDDSPACHGESFFYECLPPGDYFLVIAPATTFGVPAEQAYSLDLQTSVCSSAGTCDDVIDAGELVGTFADSRPAPIANHNDAVNGCSETINSPGFDEAHLLVLPTDLDEGIYFTMTAEGDADEVIYILGDCDNPEVSCGAVIDAAGAGPDGEELELGFIPAGSYYFVADFANAGFTAPYTLEIGATGIDARDINSFALHQNYPNPFNPVTTISWDQFELAPATLTIHNILGEVITEINLGYRGPGKHQYEWDASQLGSGIYFYTFQSGNFIETQKAMLVK